MCGFQSSSSFKIDRQTVPDGYMFGWGRTGLNIHFGGLLIVTHVPHWIIMREVHSQAISSRLPWAALWARNLAVPF